MKQKVKLVVLIPVGPVGSNYTLEQLFDTVESVVHFATTDRVIVIQDNSVPLSIGKRVQERFPEVVVNMTPTHYGEYGGNYNVDSLAYMNITAAYDFQLLVRMDIDTLWIDSGLEDMALAYFAENPKVGIIGDRPHSEQGFDWPRKMMLAQGKSPLGMLRNPKGHGMLSRLLGGAEKNGWKIGDHLLGGVQIFNPELIHKLADQRLLLREEISSLKLQDEHIFSLLCCFAGMQLGDFGGAASPMSVGWQELVDSPDSLVRAEKKVIHSVRKWGKWSEDDIRTYFHARRNATEEALEAERAEILNTSPVDF